MCIKVVKDADPEVLEKKIAEAIEANSKMVLTNIQFSGDSCLMIFEEISMIQPVGGSIVLP